MCKAHSIWPDRVGSLRSRVLRACVTPASLTVNMGQQKNAFLQQTWNFSYVHGIMPYWARGGNQSKMSSLILKYLQTKKSYDVATAEKGEGYLKFVQQIYLQLTHEAM